MKLPELCMSVIFYVIIVLAIQLELLYVLLSRIMHYEELLINVDKYESSYVALMLL